MKIKVCGLRDPENIANVAELNPDYIGHIFYRGSSRYVEAIDNYPQINPAIQKTAVFVNEDKDIIDQLLSSCVFNALQLHGTETPEFCAYFKDKIIVIKAFGIDADFDFDILKTYKGQVDYFLFDTKTVKHGGSGDTFNWDKVNNYHLDTPFFLSGGLSPDNLEQVKKIKHPQFYGVDLNSKFETVPGMKDVSKLKTAFKLIKNGL